jgi:NhaP-type Na+/H+ or K+/H+ antiporter
MMTGIVFFAGLLAYGLVSRLLEARSLTPQVVMLGLGLVLGTIALEPAEEQLDLEILKLTGEVALVLCLFVDAARIDVAALRGTAQLPVRLLAIGLPLTIAAGVVAAVLVVPGLDVIDALILAILIAPTDAALGALVVTSPAVPVRIRQALNVESGLNDGLVTPLVLVAVAIAAAEGASAPEGWIRDAASQIGWGTVAGIGVGVGGALLLRESTRRGWILDGARWLAAPALAALTWLLAGQVGGNAFVAAFIAGLATRATYGHLPEDSLEFGELGGELLGLAVFFVLGILVTAIGPLTPAVVLFAVLALTVVRMLPVAISLVGTGLAPATVAFMGWFGPRGLASVVLAIIALHGSTEATGGLSSTVGAAVTLTIVLSVFAHGLSAGPAVRAYERLVGGLPAGAPELGPAAELRTRGRVMSVGVGGSRRTTAPTTQPAPDAS